jgi:hypothetical protein
MIGDPGEEVGSGGISLSLAVAITVYIAAAPFRAAVADIHLSCWPKRQFRGFAETGFSSL